LRYRQLSLPVVGSQCHQSSLATFCLELSCWLRTRSVSRFTCCSWSLATTFARRKNHDKVNPIAKTDTVIFRTGSVTTHRLSAYNCPNRVDEGTETDYLCP
jgi:hypothetical protein